MSIRFDFLPHTGESILVTIDKKFTILVDAGNRHPFIREFSRLKIPVPKLDMLIITHIDRDHIGGAISLLKDKEQLANIKYIIFNEPDNSRLFGSPMYDYNVSGKDGDSLLNLLKDTEIKHFWRVHTCSHNVEAELSKLVPRTSFKILSPDLSALNELLSVWKPEHYKENNSVSGRVISAPIGSISDLAKAKVKMDDSIPNKSSIAFLVEHEYMKFLLLGDAHIDVVCRSLRDLGYSENHPLQVEFVKLSHHGSCRNMSDEFLSLVRADKYIAVSQRAKGSLPDKKTIAMIALIESQRKASKTDFFITKERNNFIDFTSSEKSQYRFDVIDNYTGIEY